MRILCINPNTTRAMTDRVVGLLQGRFPAGTELVPETARFGAPAIACRATFAIGGHAALEALARRAAEPWDAVLLACFGDPAWHALREVCAVPVLGMAEAAMVVAARRFGRFSIVTGGPLWEPMLGEFAAIIGLDHHLVSVRAIPATGGEIFQDPAKAQDALQAAIDACASDGAECAILGGAALAGLADGFRAQSPLPLLDPIEALATLALERIAADQAQGLGARPSPLAARFFREGWV